MVNLKDKTAATWSQGIHSSPTVSRILELRNLKLRPRQLSGIDVIIGWGTKPNTRKAREAARAADVPFVSVEDGFLRSWRPGVAGDPPLSLVIDDLGIYYDATRHSRLEALINEQGEVALDTVSLRQRFVEGGYAKYNSAARILTEPEDDRPVILVVDQTAGDMSIEFGNAAASSFREMLDAAMDENPDARILVKTHPDVLIGKRRGNFGKLPEDDRVDWFTTPVCPAALFARTSKVYTVTSQLGFEALLRDIPVRCFGVPWYAGWGLTQDEKPCERRRARPGIDALFEAAYLRYARYLNPYSHEPGQISDVMDWIDAQRLQAGAEPKRTLCLGFRAWKRGHLKNFIGHSASELKVKRSAKGIKPADLDDYDRVVIWGSREAPTLERHCRESGKPWLRMEDGFLRSVGLGSDFVRPASLVLDDLGMYYDPRKPSRLEKLLSEADMNQETLDRASALVTHIRELGISKYNLGDRSSDDLGLPADKRKILVVGQVEDDASIRLGCPGIRRNLALLERVRAENPAAFIVYKPHPDVLAGNRKGKISRSDARRICDQVIFDTDIHACIRQVDEVQVLTSLAGFEALLQDRTVVTHGQPFYAGWGLTDDRCPLSRRQRQLSLIELVAVTLIIYPCYYDWALRGFTTPESIMSQLAALRSKTRVPVRIGRVRRYRNKFSNLVNGLPRG